jgi:hypothetical protein
MYSLNYVAREHKKTIERIDKATTETTETTETVAAIVEKKTTDEGVEV